MLLVSSYCFVNVARNAWKVCALCMWNVRYVLTRNLQTGTPVNNRSGKIKGKTRVFRAAMRHVASRYGRECIWMCWSMKPRYRPRCGVWIQYLERKVVPRGGWDGGQGAAAKLVLLLLSTLRLFGGETACDYSALTEGWPESAQVQGKG